MRIAVFGSGGIGGYFGARLAAAGHEVTFIARGEHLAAIRAHGLRVESIQGDVHIHPARSTDRPAEVGVVDWVLCAVKTGQLLEAFAAMPALVGDSTVVLPLQNGVDAADRAAVALGAGYVVAGAAWIRAQIVAPGVVRHAAVEPRIVLGELDGRVSERAERLRRTLAEAGVRAEVSTDIRSVLWRKFLFISATAGVGAATRVPVDEFRALAPTRALLVAAMEESAAVARALGVRLPPEILEETLRFLDSLPAGTTSSMQRDVMAGLPSELEDQVGSVVRLGREAGVATPVNAALYAVLLPQEERARLRPAGGRPGAAPAPPA